MAKANYFLLCENFNVDTSNKVTLTNVYDLLRAEGFPTVPLKFVFAISVNLSKKEASDKLSLRVKITNKDTGKVYLDAPGEAKIEKAGNIVTSLELSGRIKLDEGKYTAELFVGDDPVMDYKFIVEKA